MRHLVREHWRGKYHCTVDLLFDWFEISCITTDIFCFYLQIRLIQTSQTEGQWYCDPSPFSIPCLGQLEWLITSRIVSMCEWWSREVNTCVLEFFWGSDCLSDDCIIQRNIVSEVAPKLLVYRLYRFFNWTTCFALFSGRLWKDVRMDIFA